MTRSPRSNAPGLWSPTLGDLIAFIVGGFVVLTMFLASPALWLGYVVGYLSLVSSTSG